MSRCIGFLEYISVAKGIEAADLITKNAAIEILLAAPNCPGRYQILFSGDVGAVKEAINLANGIADFQFLDSLILPRVDDKVFASLFCPNVSNIGDSIGIFETMTMTATIEGADTMVKSSDVEIIEIRLGKGLAGKSYVIVTGKIQNVQSAMDAALDGVKDRGVLIASSVIPSVSPELIQHLV
ncbi:BMC domain-containing protein [Candidatus Latescibacterota bacterium]